MDVAVTTPRSELGLILSGVLARQARRPGGRRVVINVAIQAPNSLLHDGHAWKRYPPARIVAETRAAVKASSGSDFLVHASYQFLGAGEAGAAVGTALLPIVDAAIAAEDIVLSSDIPSCVVRLAYLYGPELRNLRAYRRAFRIGRPYWAGPARVKQRFVHSHDAAAALLAAARQHAPGRTFSAADDEPVPFATFMDRFARLAGNPVPLHIPRLAGRLALIISDEHRQMTDLPSGDIPAGPRPRGFAPAFPTFRDGLRDVFDDWSHARRAD